MSDFEKLAAKYQRDIATKDEEIAALKLKLAEYEGGMKGDDAWQKKNNEAISK